MRRLGSVPEAHKCADNDIGIVLEIIFSAKKRSSKSDNYNKSYNTFKVWIFFCNVFQQIVISGISGVIGQVTKVT